MYYRYSKKWVDLFKSSPEMASLESIHYIKGMHNLLSAHFDLQNYDKFNETLQIFEEYAASDIVQLNINNQIQVFVYLTISKINKHFMAGTFKEGLLLVPEIEKNIEEYEIYLDRHRILVFYYKIASL